MGYKSKRSAKRKHRTRSKKGGTELTREQVKELGLTVDQETMDKAIMSLWPKKTGGTKLRKRKSRRL